MYNLQKSSALLVTLGLLTMLPLAQAGAEDNCNTLGVPSAACDAAGPLLQALERLAGGVSAADFTDAPQASLDVANFYFSPRVSIVEDGQTVVWKNVNAPGGNRHSVISGDIGGSEPVLPIFVGDTGGGAAFKSGELQPGDTFQMTINLAAMNPAGYQPLPNGDFLITYHCYIHGSSQMNGVFLVKAS